MPKNLNFPQRTQEKISEDMLKYSILESYKEIQRNVNSMCGGFRERLVNFISNDPSNHPGILPKFEELPKFEQLPDFIKKLNENFTKFKNEISDTFKKQYESALENSFDNYNATLIHNIDSIKEEFKNLYKQIVVHLKEAFPDGKYPENYDKNFCETLRELGDNVIDFLIVLEKNNINKKLLENFKGRSEIEPIPGTLGLFVYSVKKAVRSAL